VKRAFLSSSVSGRAGSRFSTAARASVVRMAGSFFRQAELSGCQWVGHNGRVSAAPDELPLKAGFMNQNPPRRGSIDIPSEPRWNPLTPMNVPFIPELIPPKPDVAPDIELLLTGPPWIP
jgi:hypothetical protein